MAKIFDPQIINTILTGYVEELITNQGNLVASKPFEIAAKPIDEYEGRMRVKATDKFDVSVYISSTSFYLNDAEKKAHRARGAMVLYLDSEVADKIFKAAGLQVPYDEDDESMMGLGGSLCLMIADALNERLSAAGYLGLTASVPANYKNSIPDGIEFSKDQDEKQEISFYFLKHKALVIEWTMAPILKK